MQVSTSPDFLDNATRTIITTQLVTLVEGLQLHTSYHFRAALQPIEFPSDVQLPSGLSLPLLWSSYPSCSCASGPTTAACDNTTAVGVETRLPEIHKVSLVGSDALPGSGGAQIVVDGDWLGVNASVIQLRYVGGLQGQPQREYHAASCRVSVPNQQLICVSVAGVGGHFRFQVIVDGGASAWSTDWLSYSPPVLVSLSSPTGSVSLPTDVSCFHSRCAQFAFRALFFSVTIVTRVIAGRCGDCVSRAQLWARCHRAQRVSLV